jgi:hypothetical protein
MLIFEKGYELLAFGTPCDLFGIKEQPISLLSRNTKARYIYQLTALGSTVLRYFKRFVVELDQFDNAIVHAQRQRVDFTWRRVN